MLNRKKKQFIYDLLFNDQLNTNTINRNTDDFELNDMVCIFLCFQLFALQKVKKTGFIVLFMAKNPKTNNSLHVYITTKKGAIMDITTSSRLNHTLKQQIDRRVTIPSSHHINISSAIKLGSFEKEVKSILLETFDNAFCVIVDYHLYTSGGTAIIPLHKLSTKYVVIST